MRQRIPSKIYSLNYLQLIGENVTPVKQVFGSIDQNISTENYYAFSKSILRILDTNYVDALVHDPKKSNKRKKNVRR